MFSLVINEPLSSSDLIECVATHKFVAGFPPEKSPSRHVYPKHGLYGCYHTTLGVESARMGGGGTDVQQIAADLQQYATGSITKTREQKQKQRR